jgi:enoyl-CoA hydratase
VSCLECIGGGVDLITAADFRLATKDAEFSIKETQIAIVADLGTLQRIGRIVPKGVVRQMVI